MTGEQKQYALDMRQQGLGFSQIASSLGLSVNTVKSFYRRHNLASCSASKESKTPCKHCGKPLEQSPKTKPKAFCGDTCRYTWWNANSGDLRQKAMHRISCACCNRVFHSYGSKNRKYCSHACYIKNRFEGGIGCDERAV